ncbi:hypothetical protein Tco_0504963 [Tanacetum coccineum]
MSPGKVSPRQVARDTPDLSLGNIANVVVCNCDFKMRYANETEDMELQVSESQSKLAYANDTQNIEMEAGDSPTNLNSKGAKRKEYKDRSRVGNHFTKFFDNNEKPRAKCNYCGVVYSGETKSRTSTL